MLLDNIENPSPQSKHSRSVKLWLITGLVMLFMQVVIGGVTRLTGSGLSITKWDIVMGTLPPLNAAQWNEAFDLYKQTPQFHKLNFDMDLGEFKYIFFWEYFHRLWARSMGLVFLLPFLWFWARGQLSRQLVRRLGGVVLLAALVAVFGWIMVASGLVNRPWVNAYKLSIHLSLALLTYAYLLWTTFEVFDPSSTGHEGSAFFRKWGIRISVLLGVQIFVGGIMSGMKAGLYFPTWPDMNGEIVPGIVFNISEWNVDNFVHYDSGRFAPALVQTIHRFIAYILAIIVLWYFYKIKKNYTKGQLVTASGMLVTMLIIQVTLGIVTVIKCGGQVPVLWGVLHQAGAILLLTAALYNNFVQRRALANA
jgi:cytochrome c oxidase assembly protein subunit 15